MIPHAYFVMSPLITLNFALYGRVANRGLPGYLAGVAGGFLWSILAGLFASWLQRQAGSISGDTLLFCCIIDSGILAGSEILYLLVFGSALREPSLTNDVLSAMMRPTVPYYIALNSFMEVLFVPLVVFLNWDAGAAPRWVVVAAAALYVLQRSWTYIVYAERRLATGTALSAEDVAWFRRTLAQDYRTVLNLIVMALFAAAAFLRP